MDGQKVKLTKGAVERLAAVPGQQLFVWDTALRGFGLRISPGGAKTFIMQRRVGARTRRISIGRAGDMTPEKARKIAEGLAAQFAEGVDPVAEKRRQERARLTLRQAFEDYITAPVKKGGGKGAAKKPRTVRDIEKHMAFFRDWLDLTVTEIKPLMVKRRHGELVARSAAQGNLSMRYLRAAINHAIADTDDDDAPILPRNPVSKLNKMNLWSAVPVKKRHLRRDQIGQWVEVVLTGLVGLRHERELRDVLMFFLLTGARFSEALGSDQDGYRPLAWDDVDFERRTITFNNTKNRIAHEIPLATWLGAMLAERREVSGEEFVFSAPDGSRPTDIRGAIMRIASLTGLHITAHDLRRTFATAADALDIGRYAVKRMMNHVSGGDVTSGYVQVDTDRLREPMQCVEDYMLGLAGMRPSVVVPLRAQA